ncbi:phenylpyruvate tautomerase MIF-related protein [Synechococcus elongatus]|uniref:L-dopachrome isomerase n=1 Tax=Synechococcus elongatus PCC 11801 TaxID=2219813 RepID=A0AAN1UTT9_SYNEL|nr:phenylpyruvate tautomerase MIF-related protein [Synechococcus elongatus]AZB71853.1 hypothetical protein DOP62_03125 [Synechococcus elongatus PCC 11801]
MPLIKLQTSIAALPSEQTTALLKSLSSTLAQQLGKPERYVMTLLETNIPMTFAGTFDPACYVEIKSVGQMKPTQTAQMSRLFCDQIASELGIASDRIYIEFADAQGYLWGWNGSTFG